MSLLGALKRTVPAPVKRFLRRNTPESRLAMALSPSLPPVICVDVGASYYPHIAWRVFLESPATRWIAVEPNEGNLGYVSEWPWRSAVSTVTTGLSRDGGTQFLYVTNIDSGSSLLEPVITPSMQHRVRNLDYFFPLQKREIATLTLADVIAMEDATLPVVVKLDTQGTELSIVSGAASLRESKRVVGIELEATLLAEPVMQGAGKFWEAMRDLERFGFELLHIKPIQGPSRLGTIGTTGRRYLNECDAVFALRPDVAATLSVGHRAALLGFYASNRLYEEALWLLESDGDVRRLLGERGCNIERLDTLLRELA